jgi:hypothetical protein
MKANCQYCRKELNVTLDPNYDGLNDPSGLLRSVACSKCASFKQKTPKLFWEWLAKKRMEESATVV